MENFSEIALFLRDLSKKAEEILLKHYAPGGQPFDLKEDNSHVTKADLEVNDMVIKEINEHYPDYGVLAEEESVNEDREKLFVIDPLDGTRMFVAGAPLFCFSAAVVIDGESQAGVLCNPLAKRTLLAEKGKGAYIVETNKKIKVSEKETLDGAMVNDGWRRVVTAKLLHEAGAMTPQLYVVTEIAQLIATGGFDGEIFLGVMAHDVAAAKIVVEEAGGRVTDIEGKQQRYDRKVLGAIISNGKLHDAILDIVDKGKLVQLFKDQYPD